jgi:capsule biosynthesis phosphatase
MKQIVIDLDGTLCEQTKGGDAYFTASPFVSIINKVNKKYKEGYNIIIFTARGMNSFNGNVRDIEDAYRLKTEKWLNDNNVLYHELKFGKPPGDFYIDDKAVRPCEPW